MSFEEYDDEDFWGGGEELDSPEDLDDVFD